MRFTYPNIYFTTNGFWMRWTVIAFISINIILLVYLLIKKLKEKSITLTHNIRETFLLPALVYLSTIPIYYFREIIGDKGNSVIYKSAEYLNSVESLVVIALIATLFYGFTYKNSYTFINFYFKTLAVLEITYIISCYITSQVDLDQWFNWLGVILFGIAFVILNRIKIKPTQTNTPRINPHNATNRYDSLFSVRKYQANEVVDIIESSISESGYSICVSGEWGMGKTSLANGALDKASENKKANKSNYVDIYDICINTMELDDSVSLINYFFKKIEEILKANKIYVGIASEYKELVTSISGSIIHESASSFLSKKLNSGNTDYRENIKKLSQLLTNNLINSRIIIIIDDIERCSSEKAKSFLFLMKEIATMNRCITLFLADIDKLKVSCDLDESFFEKFFNHTISLATVRSDEIFSSRRETSVDSSDLFQEIEKMLKRYDEKIIKTEKELFLYIQGHQERREYKEARINSIKEDKERFSNHLSNPRRLGKVMEYYERLIRQVNQQRLNCPNEKQESVDLFLGKVDYRKQLSLLSIIYGLYNSEFAWIQRNGIYNYIGEFASRFKLAEPPEENIHIVDSLLDGEWYYLLRILSSDFRIQEVLRFVNCVLSNIDELSNISNGYSSLEESYISIIKGGNLPDDINFSDLVAMIYSATYNKALEREQLIKRIFDLYKKNMSANSVDAAFDLFSNNKAINYFSSDTPVLQMFSNTFCTDNCHLASPEKIVNKFISFANGYLWCNVTILSRYFLPISSLERVSYEMWNNTNESVLAKEGCENMLNAYCEKCESHLDFSVDTPDTCAILRLDNIINKVSAKYSEFDMAECSDVLQACENAKKIALEIAALFKIECFINECNTSVKDASFSIRDISNDKLDHVIDKLNNIFSESIEYSRNNDIQSLLQFICGNEHSITFDEYEKLISLVEKYCEEHNGIASWRQMLIYIKRHKVK